VGPLARIDPELIGLQVAPAQLRVMGAELRAGGMENGTLTIWAVEASSRDAYLLWCSPGESPIAMVMPRAALLYSAAVDSSAQKFLELYDASHT